MNAILLSIYLSTGFPHGYRMLVVIAIGILGYLLYALFKPEKF